MISELILLKPSMQKRDFDLKLKLNDKRLYQTKLVKYLSIKIDEKLTQIDHINDTAIKRNMTNDMLFICYTQFGVKINIP